MPIKYANIFIGICLVTWAALWIYHWLQAKPAAQGQYGGNIEIPTKSVLLAEAAAVLSFLYAAVNS